MHSTFSVTRVPEPPRLLRNLVPLPRTIRDEDGPAVTPSFSQAAGFPATPRTANPGAYTGQAGFEVGFEVFQTHQEVHLIVFVTVALRSCSGKSHFDYLAAAALTTDVQHMLSLSVPPFLTTHPLIRTHALRVPS